MELIPRKIIAGARHNDILQVREIAEMILDAGEDLAIYDGDFRARIVESVFEFITRPPRIHWRGNRADRQCSKEGHRPLRIIPHDHGHAVAFLNAKLLAQDLGEMFDSSGKRGISHALIFIDQIIARAELWLGQF